MSTETELDEAWLLFEQDALRSLDEAEQHLLALEADASADLHGLYRALHSLKGNARVMGLEQLESLTHRAEDLVALYRDGTAEADPFGVGLLLEAMDLLRREVPSAVSSRSDVDPERAASLVERIGELVGILDESGSRSAMADADGMVFDSAFDDISFDLDDLQPPVIPPAGSAPVEVEPVRVEPEAPKRSPGGPVDQKRETFIQVRSSKIQELLALASDLGLSVDTLLTHPSVLALAESREEVLERAHRVRRLMRELRFAAAGLALVPVGELFAKVRRVARELTRATGREFEVVLEGEETEIDKSLVDALGDPVLHIIRNAVDHGLEAPEERRAAGKSPVGRVTVSASYAGNEVLLSFSDDGRGLDTEAIRRKALARGLIGIDQSLDESAIHQLVLQPGFSTKEQVSELSGRGVGMDVVAERVKSLRGRLDLESRRGLGTRLTLHLPLTLAFADALVVEVDGYLFAIPLERVGHILLPEREAWIRSSAASVDYLDVHGRSLPIAWLGEDLQPGDRKPVVTIQTAQGAVALPVDRLRGTEQITIRPLDRYSRHSGLASSCGILGSGDIAVTLDCDRIEPSRLARQSATRSAPGM